MKDSLSSRIYGKGTIRRITKKVNLLGLKIDPNAFIGFRFVGLYKLGDPVSQGSWDTWKVPRNIYNNFNNKNRSMMVSGLYEYPLRDLYIYTKQLINPKTKEKVEEVNRYLNSLDFIEEKNKYTGIFKDKNLIMIMMESIDISQVNKEVMPTLSYLAKTGINFENR